MGVIDVDEIIEHQLNANMLLMPYHVYSELFDAVDGLGVGIENLQSENAKLRELVNGLTWCAEHTCRKECPLHDMSEPDHCREMRLKRELGIEFTEEDE